MIFPLNNFKEPPDFFSQNFFRNITLSSSFENTSDIRIFKKISGLGFNGAPKVSILFYDSPLLFDGEVHVAKI